jgi:hypothetical protein
MLALRDSTELSGQSCVYTLPAQIWSLEKSLSMPSDSGAIKDVARRSWHLHVGPLLVVTIVVSLSESGISRTQVTVSWEFVTNLHCEWAIIRGHQTYRWTIWVRDDEPLF